MLVAGSGCVRRCKTLDLAEIRGPKSPVFGSLRRVFAGVVADFDAELIYGAAQYKRIDAPCTSECEDERRGAAAHGGVRPS